MTAALNILDILGSWILLSIPCAIIVGLMMAGDDGED
jgi:hypothetical protein